MRKGIGFFAVLLVTATVMASLTVASASAMSPNVADWLTPSCWSLGNHSETPDLITDDRWEGDYCDMEEGTTANPICVDGTTYDIYNSDEDQEEREAFVADIRAEGSSAFFGACTGPEPQGPDRYIYCAAAGNTDANGNPLGAGQTLNLKYGEPDQDKHYTGATLGFWVQGAGLTCQLTPEQAALAAASTTKVNHTGAANTQEGAQVYTFVPAA